MLPSMPVLFTRDSQDAFGNKIEPSTSFFGQHNITKQLVQPTFQPPAPRPPSPRPVVKESKPKEDDKDKDLNGEETKKLDENEQEAALAAAYFNKIRSKFASHTRVPQNNKFVQFRDILKTFDPATETPVELYKKIETMFGEEHKYLADEFLLFLTPGQTTEIGMFMDQFVMLQLKAFIDLLQSTFARKPTMLRKVLRAITNSLNCGSTDEMRAKVLPHLRANPRLQHIYRALFPDARPPDSVYESGVDKIAEGFLSDDPGYDAWQLEDKAEDKRRNLEAKEQLDSMYLQGRVYLQHGRHLRPARLAFPYSPLPHRTHARRLAPAHDPDPDPDPDPPHPPAPPKRRRGKKDVNDNTKAEPKARKRRPKKDPEKKDPKDPNPKCRKKKKEVKNNSWTREEDKTILEVLKGGSVPDEVLVKIKELLPHRTASEIKERFFHVMTLLQQMMAVGEVT